MIFRTIIVAELDAPKARSLVVLLAGADAEGMFQTPLYNSAGVRTHYISSGLVATELATKLPCNGVGGDIAAIVSLANGLVTAADIARMDISDIPVSDTLTRLGLDVKRALV
jgi:hypothetical protein